MLSMAFFSGGKGGGELIDYGYKGKGVTTHLLVDGDGNPLSFEVTSAKGDERQQVEKLVDLNIDKLQRLYDLHQIIPILEADKGYDCEELRDKLLRRKIYPLIARRRIGAAKNEANCLPTQKNGDGKLKELYLGCKGSLEGL